MPSAPPVPAGEVALTCSGVGSANVPLTSLPGFAPGSDTLSAASPAVVITSAAMLAV